MSDRSSGAAWDSSRRFGGVGAGIGKGQGPHSLHMGGQVTRQRHSTGDGSQLLSWPPGSAGRCLGFLAVPVTVCGMKLAQWARENGVNEDTAYRWFHAGVLPVPAPVGWPA